MSQNKKFIEYFPLIDSLRAISVIAVIIYHLDINFLGRQFFSGGYLGVDIFFFISGYLITEIIYTEYIKNVTSPAEKRAFRSAFATNMHCAYGDPPASFF